jgi:hypothetical protein
MAATPPLRGQLSSRWWAQVKPDGDDVSGIFRVDSVLGAYSKVAPLLMIYNFA